jgi:hypothetical protein
MLVLAMLALAFKMRALEKKLSQLKPAALTKQERPQTAAEKVTREDLALFRNDLNKAFESLRVQIERVPTATVRLLPSTTPEPPPPRNFPGQRPPSSAASTVYEERGRDEDLMPQLLNAANRIVQHGSTTLDAFSASGVAAGTPVSAWPGPGGGDAVAFIVKHRGSFYAIPNVVKPTRLPPEWFNRGEFGVNDEIHRVLSLPRLRQRGGKYEVEEPGVFAQ